MPERHEAAISCRIAVRHTRAKSQNMVACSRIIWITLCFLLFVSDCLGIDDKTGCASDPLYSRFGMQGDKVRSPDRKYGLTITKSRDTKDPDGYIYYRLKVGNRVLDARLTGWRTEVLWAPDSRAFAINQTVGGGGIGQRAYIFYIGAERLKRVDVYPLIERAFGSPVKCDVPVPPNTAVLQWLDSNRILVVAEVVPTSICKCGGTFKTYEVVLPQLEILRVYDQGETRARFPDALGCELRRADDVCARTWQK